MRSSRPAAPRASAGADGGRSSATGPRPPPLSRTFRSADYYVERRQLAPRTRASLGEEMVVVYLKNGEKAPMPDANFVKLEPVAEASGTMLRCFFGDREVGRFKWEEVAGYTVDVLAPQGPSSPGAFEAWGVRPDA